MLVMSFFRDLRSVENLSPSLGQMHADEERARDLQINGRPGTATITALRRTGTFVNENPEVEMDLEVTVDGMTPYAATHRQVIAVIASPQFQPGSIVPVKVDPGEPTSLIVA
jgi:hypothetical protein